MSPGQAGNLWGRPSHHKSGGIGGKNGFGVGPRTPLPLFSLWTVDPASQLLQLQSWLKGTKVHLKPWLQRVKSQRLGGFHVMLGLWYAEEKS